MTHTNDGGPAFPGFEHYIADREDSKGPVKVITGQPHGGLSIRDYFAAKAIAGLLGYVSADDFQDGKFKWRAAEIYADAAGKIADAMLAERTK